MFRRLRKLFGFESRLTQRELQRRARPAVECLEDRLTPSAVSITYTVPAGNVSNSGSGTTGGLVWAINQTNSDHHTGADFINLTASSNPYLFLAPANPSAADGPTDMPTIGSTIIINGNGDTIAGSLLFPARLFDVSGQGSLTLNNLTLEDGLAIGSGDAGSGGAIFSSGLLYLQNVTLDHNLAIGAVGSAGQNGSGGNGGAIYIATGSAILTDVTFSNNSAAGGNGGSGGTNGSTAPSGGQGAGGGLYVAGGDVTLSDDTFASNTAAGGTGGQGGDLTHGSGHAGYGGTGGSGVGGALYVGGNSDVVMNNCTLANNTAQGGSGGAGGNLSHPATGYVGAGGSGGSSYGGGVYVTGGTLSLTNDTIALNNAQGGSGGLGGTAWFSPGGRGGSGSAGVGTGGGLFSNGSSDTQAYGTIHLANTLIAENTDQAGAPDTWGAVASSDHDLIGDDNATWGLTGSDILNPTFVGIGTLQSNGGPTQTIALLSGSPAIDAGNDSLAPAATDQDGNARIVGQHIDIGAYEYNAVAAAADLSVAIQAPAAVTPGGNLTYTITVTDNSSTINQNDVTVADVLPANTSFVSWSVPTGWASDEPASGSSGTASAWIGTLPAGTSDTFTLTVSVSGSTANGYQLIDTASVGPLTGDPIPVNNSTDIATSVVTALPTQLAFLETPANTTAGQTLKTVQVVLEDSNGNLVSGDNTDLLTLKITSGPGVFSSGFSGVSARVVNGVATFSGLALDTAGSYTLAADISGVAAITTPAFTISPAAVSKLAFTLLPSPGTAGTALGGGAVRVALEDQYGNVETGTSTGTIGMAIASGPAGFTKSSTTSASVSKGVANFSNLVFDTAGTYKLKATSSNTSLKALTSAAITVNPAAASQLVFTIQPKSTTAGKTMSNVQVSLEDTYGNVITQDSQTQLTLAVTQSPSSSATITLSDGVATFTNLYIVTAGTYTFTASATVKELRGANEVSVPLNETSSSFTISPAAVSQLAFTIQPSTGTAGQKLSTVKLALEDQYGNIETGQNADTIALSIAKGSAASAFSGGTTSVVVSHGVATFSNLVLDTAGTYNLTATSKIISLPSVTSGAIDVSPAAASKLVFSTQPVNAMAGSTLTAVQVSVEDKYGNVETQDISDQVTVSGAGFTNNSTLSATVSKGSATFGNLVLDTAGKYTLKAVSGTLRSAKSASFAIVQDVSNDVTITAGPMRATSGGSFEYQQEVTIRNDSSSTLSGRLALVLPDSGSTKYLYPATGSFLGESYLDIPGSNNLGAGESVRVIITFLGSPLSSSPPASPDYTQVLEGI